MAIEPFPAVKRGITLEQLATLVGMSNDNLNFLFDGNIDTLNVGRLDAKVIIAESIKAGKLAADSVETKNIQAEAITTAKLDALAVTAEKIAALAIETSKLAAGAVTADKITVAVLSAISADLGHIVAGLIESVTIIGSEIMTQTAGNYPRTELSTSGNLLKAEASATEYIAIFADYGGLGNARLQFVSDNVQANMQNSGNDLLIGTSSSGEGIQISSRGDLMLLADVFDSTKLVQTNSWSRFYSQGDHETLQDVINALSARIQFLEDNAFTNAFRAGSTIEFDSKNYIKVDVVSIA